MKNKAIYNVVSKTALLDIFKKNNVMVKTYFGELGPAPRWALDFSDPDTQQELINAEIFDATSWKAQTLYKRNNLMTFTALELGISLKGNSGTSGRAEYRYTFPKAITDKVVTYETELKVQAPETPSYGTTTQLYANKIISSTNAVVASMEFSASNIILKALGADNTTVSYPEGTTAYSDLTIKMEFDLVTKNVKYYVNESLLGTLVSTGDDAAMINLSCSSNTTVQNETEVLLYSADITVKEHEDEPIEPTVITFDDYEVQTFASDTEKELADGIWLLANGCTAVSIRENTPGYTCDDYPDDTYPKLLRVKKATAKYPGIAIDIREEDEEGEFVKATDYTTVTLVAKSTSATAGNIKNLSVVYNGTTADTGLTFDSGSKLYKGTYDFSKFLDDEEYYGLTRIQFQCQNGDLDIAKIIFE